MMFDLLASIGSASAKEESESERKFDNSGDVLNAPWFLWMEKS